ncbi:hypothetical protein SS50377_24893 [Spironucleus salmonicida]|uniref:Uncharacterized protein n=1 Tax=Spironucleus salmonicida TaxID=348837 RepID=V6LI87_9EUKA|nr:hypothetical protein SS50377_24893 [Spironucleus salmonicida]|eukprot:EST43426.1 Hypothetical protein SS50377_16786 [Spironucleus salmonicida]
MEQTELGVTLDFQVILLKYQQILQQKNQLQRALVELESRNQEQQTIIFKLQNQHQHECSKASGLKLQIHRSQTNLTESALSHNQQTTQLATQLQESQKELFTSKSDIINKDNQLQKIKKEVQDLTSENERLLTRTYDLQTQIAKDVINPHASYNKQYQNLIYTQLEQENELLRALCNQNKIDTSPLAQLQQKFCTHKRVLDAQFKSETVQQVDALQRQLQTEVERLQIDVQCAEIGAGAQKATDSFWREQQVLLIARCKNQQTKTGVKGLEVHALLAQVRELMDDLQTARILQNLQDLNAAELAIALGAQVSKTSGCQVEVRALRAENAEIHASSAHEIRSLCEMFSIKICSLLDEISLQDQSIDKIGAAVGGDELEIYQVAQAQFNSQLKQKLLRSKLQKRCFLRKLIVTLRANQMIQGNFYTQITSLEAQLQEQKDLLVRFQEESEARERVFSEERSAQQELLQAMERSEKNFLQQEASMRDMLDVERLKMRCLETENDKLNASLREVEKVAETYREKFGRVM